MTEPTLAEHRQELDAQFGCDRCGLPRHPFHGTSGTCPHATPHVRDWKYRQPIGWVDDGHELRATFVYGQLRLNVHCPHDEDGICRQRSCFGCEGAKLVDNKPCPDCDGSGSVPGPHQCALQEYLEADDDGFLDLAEQWITEVPVPCRMLWHSDPDLIQWRPVAPRSQTPA